VAGDLQRAAGAYLRAYRRARHLSQEAFADVFGWSRSYMGRIERGQQNLTLRTLERIAQAIGVDPIELLTGQPP
jgi:transcriptional regulator with XRE-family HTH domain